MPGFVKGASGKLAAGFAAFDNCGRRHLVGGDTPARAACIVVVVIIIKGVDQQAR